MGSRSRAEEIMGDLLPRWRMRKVWILRPRSSGTWQLVCRYTAIYRHESPCHERRARQALGRGRRVPFENPFALNDWVILSSGQRTRKKNGIRHTTGDEAAPHGDTRLGCMACSLQLLLRLGLSGLSYTSAFRAAHPRHLRGVCISHCWI